MAAMARYLYAGLQSRRFALLDELRALEDTDLILKRAVARITDRMA